MELMNLTTGGLMKLTGNERYPVWNGRELVYRRLADMTADEILAYANGRQRQGDPGAGALYDYQAQRRRRAMNPGPQAA